MLEYWNVVYLIPGTPASPAGRRYLAPFLLEGKVLSRCFHTYLVI